MLPEKHFQVIVIDDDYVIRYAIVNSLKALKDDIPEKIFVYGASNGLDGLGSIFVTNPDVIIIDTTLPKFSGREVIDFISTNERFNNSLIITLNERVPLKNLPDSYLQIQKDSNDFIEQIENAVSLFIGRNLVTENFSGFEEIQTKVVDKTVNFANEADKLYFEFSTRTDIFSKFFFLSKWIFFSFLTSVPYLISKIIERDEPEDEIETKDKYNGFRVMHIPLLSTMIFSTIVILIQIFLFGLGGVVKSLNI